MSKRTSYGEEILFDPSTTDDNQWARCPGCKSQPPCHQRPSCWSTDPKISHHNSDKGIQWELLISDRPRPNVCITLPSTQAIKTSWVTAAQALSLGLKRDFGHTITLAGSMAGPQLPQDNCLMEFPDHNIEYVQALIDNSCFPNSVSVIPSFAHPSPTP